MKKNNNNNIALNEATRNDIKVMLDHLTDGPTSRYKHFNEVAKTINVSATTLYNIYNKQSHTLIHYRTLEGIESAYKDSMGIPEGLPIENLIVENYNELPFNKEVSKEQQLVDEARRKVAEINAIDKELKLLSISAYISRDYVDGDGLFVLTAEKSIVTIESL